MPFPRASQALSRFTVLDLTRVRAGPTCVRYFADWGANCIKVEMPPGVAEGDMGGPRHGPDFQNLHRNKRSITLNLKDPEGLAIFRKLADGADVVVENFRPDVKFRLGIDHATLAKEHPRLVYASISGYGQSGPLAQRAGHDINYLARSGMLATSVHADGRPVLPQAQVADIGGGTYPAVINILLALRQRDLVILLRNMEERAEDVLGHRLFMRATRAGERQVGGEVGQREPALDACGHRLRPAQLRHPEPPL